MKRGVRKQADDIMTLGKLVYASETETWQARAEALRAARDEAVAALEPFAKLADQIDAWGHGDDSTCEHRLKASDLRRARATQPAGKEKG